MSSLYPFDVLIEAAINVATLMTRQKERFTSITKWIDEITVPPPDVRVTSRYPLTGFLFIDKGEVKRGILSEERSQQSTSTGKHSGPLARSSPFSSLQDDDFPAFG